MEAKDARRSKGSEPGTGRGDHASGRRGGGWGGGFPTYFKYKNPQPRLIVNCTESEQGYWADKMLHREYFDDFLQIYEVLKENFGIEKVIMGVHFKDEEWFERYDESADGLYEVVHVADKYSMGEEKTLIKNIFYEDKSRWVPRLVEMPDGNRRPGLPLGGRFLKPATALVSEGDGVSNEQKIGEPVDDGFSIGVCASSAGTVESIENDVVAISGGEEFKEEAEAEAEAEASR